MPSYRFLQVHDFISLTNETTIIFDIKRNFAYSFKFSFFLASDQSSFKKEDCVVCIRFITAGGLFQVFSNRMQNSI